MNILTLKIIEMAGRVMAAITAGMSPASLAWLTLAVLGLVGSIFFSGLETGFYMLSRPRLEIRCWKKDPAALRLAGWLKRPAGVIAGLLIWQNICNFSLSAAIAALLQQRHVGSAAQALRAAAVALPLLLIFGEIIPKDLFLTHADRWMYRLVRPLQWALAVITVLPLLPLLRGLDWLTRRMFRSHPNENIATPPRLLAFAEESTAGGFISDTHHDLIRRGLRMAHVTVGDVMVEWNRVIGLPVGISRKGFEALVRRYHVSRLAVLGRSAEDVLGIVNVVDALGDPGPPDLLRHLQPAMTLLPEQSVRSAIKLLQAARHTIALVVNRQGRVIGLATMKDLVEELLGDLK